MRVLLVEDEAPKRNHICRFLQALPSPPDISFARSVNSTLDELENNLPDVMILDMSLPTSDIDELDDGGRPQGFGGLEVLRYMVLSEVICPVVVLTGYDAFKRKGETIDLARIRDELLSEFDDFLIAVLYFSSAYDDWREQLSKLLLPYNK